MLLNPLYDVKKIYICIIITKPEVAEIEYVSTYELEDKYTLIVTNFELILIASGNQQSTLKYIFAEIDLYSIKKNYQVFLLFYFLEFL